MKEILDDKEEKKEELATEEERIITEGIESELGFKPKIVKVKANDDRILPEGHIPDEAKEKEYLMRIGKPLPAALYNRETAEKIDLPAKIGQVYRHAIRMARIRYKEKQNQPMRDKRTENTQKLLFNYVLKRLDQEDSKKFQSGDWSVRSKTTQVEYERLAGTVFRALEQYKDDGENKKEETAKEAPALVSFKQIDINKLKRRILDAGIEVIKTTQKKVSPSPAIPSTAPNFLEGRPLNRLQKLRLSIGRAISRGESFDKVATEYTELREYMHWYLTRRLATIDLFGRYGRGEIQNMPENILSVASGPFAETEAQADLNESYSSMRLKSPKVTNLDISEKMLILGRSEVGTADALKADMCALPFKEKSFDLTENTSLHLPLLLKGKLSKHLHDLLQQHGLEKNGKGLQALALAEMSRVTSENGLVRIIYKEKPPEYMYDLLQQYNLELLTPPNIHFDVSREVIKILEEMFPGKEGRLLAKRAATKSSNDFYILARKRKTQNGQNGLYPKHIESLGGKAESDQEKRLRGERINWHRTGLGLSGEELRKELQRREKEFEIVIRNDDMNEAKNLFWEFGRAGRESNIASGDIDIESAEALPTSILLNRAGSRKFRKTLEALSRKIWPESRK